MPIFRGKQLISSNSDYKDSARVALRSNLNLAASVTVIDGVTLSDKDRVLLVKQDYAAENGIYTWSSTTRKLTRTTDADSSDEVSAGMRIYVEEGTVNAKSIWIVISTGQITVGSSAIVFAKDGVINTADLSGTYGSSTKSVTLSIDESGNITAVSESDIPTFTAGRGINIINGTISIDSTVLTLDDIQTIDNKNMDGGEF
jgi:phage-related tail fiber protein